jgi:hypothetical protein
MSSSRRVLWFVPRAGQLRCLKKAPEKKSFWIDLYYTRGPKKERFAGFYEIHGLPTRFIEERIKLISEAYQSMDFQSIQAKVFDFARRAEIALDFLFAELGRRASRRMIS